MHHGQSGHLLGQLRRLLRPHAPRELDDAELLRRFAESRDEEAFAALVQKHGRLVWTVCCHVLRHDHDAEDAFQGTFLVLARKAGSIRNRHSVAGWLHGVAYRVAHKARVAAARRRGHEARAAAPPVAPPASEMAWRELQAILDEELHRLPEKHRSPFVLCCLDGRSKKEAAQELGWKEGTVSSRLAHARKLLQHRLARRGVMLSVLLAGTVLARETAVAAAPPLLGSATVKAALAFVARQGLDAAARSGAVALAEAVLRTMAVSRLRAGLVLLALVGLAGTSAAWALHQATAGSAQPDASGSTENRVNEDAHLQRDPVAPVMLPPGQTPQEEAMTVTGRVLDRDGRPLPGAVVAVVAGEFHQAAPAGKQALDSGQADAQGQFHFSLQRPFARRYYGVSLLAAAPGFAPSWYTVSPSEGVNEVECKLEPGQAVRGQLLDSGGTPAAGVTVHVAGLVRQGPGASVLRFARPPEGLPWPAPATTDDQGRFLLRDVPAGEIDLQVRDERFAPQWLVLKTGPKEAAEPVKLTLEPRRILEGTVAGADTGAAVPHARLVVQSFGQGAAARLVSKAEGQADAEGRFRLSPFPGQELVVSAYPAPDAPYLGLQESVKWPGGNARHELRLPLPRGVLVHGRVVEAPSGRPVPGAVVEYEPRTDDNPAARPGTGTSTIDWWSQDVRSGPDGTFRLAVLPGPGTLLVKGPSPDYVHVEVSARQFQAGKLGGTPYFPDAVVPLDLKLSPPAQELAAVTLRRGMIVTGRVVGSEGRPMSSAFLLAPTYLPLESALRSNLLPMRLPVRDGRFELPGCDPEQSVPVLFLDPRNQEGAVAELSGKQAGGEPVVVRLAPCGSAVARVVDPTGRPLSRPAVRLDALLRPGADLQDSINNQVEACLMVPVQRLADSPGISADAQTGAVVFSGLIPGATYLVQADEGNGLVRKATIRVQAGERLTLPDIVLAPPNAGRR